MELLKLQSDFVGTDDSDWLQATARVSDWVILALLSIVEIGVLVQLKFKMDFSGKLTLLLHFIVAVLRVFQDYEDYDGVASNVLGTFCQMLIWFSLYYFTFEMKLIQEALKFNSP